MKSISQKLLLLLVTLLMFLGTDVYAEDNDISNIESQFDFQKVATMESSATVNTERLELIKNNLKYVLIIAGLYAFSLIIITVLMKMTPSHQAKDVVTAVGLVSVIFSSLILVLVVDTSDALTAPMGILGAIAGYLFGSAQKTTSAKKE
jgi:uncharacterized membrane protein YfcA